VTNLHVLVCDSDGGTDVTVSSSGEEMWRKKYLEIKEIWPACPYPIEQAEAAVQGYFDEHPDEWFVYRTIPIAEVYGANKRALDYFEQPNTCPFCGSMDLDTSPITAENDQAVQEIRCLACNKGWSDVYQLVGAEMEDYR